jgi:hypothetical protein
VIALTRSELRRATSRRLVRVAIIVALLGVVAVAVLIAAHSHRPTPAQIAAARTSFASEQRRCLAGKYFGPNQVPNGETLPQWCAGHVREEAFVPHAGFELGDLPHILAASSVLLILGALLIGASLVGAEWHAGTMTTLLTWEPRRLRVMAAKGLAAATVVAILAILVLLALSAMLSIVAATRGSTLGVDPSWYRSVAGAILRVTAACSVVALIGLSVAMVGRNTSAAIGLGFAYLGVVEGLIRGLRPGWQPWLLGDNVAVFVSGLPQRLGPIEAQVTRTVGGAAIVASVYAVALLAIAAVTFRSRDVT